MPGRNELRQRAWRLIYAAKNSTNPKLRRMLMTEAFEFVQQAEALSEPQAPGIDMAVLGTEPYRICFRHDGRTVFWIELEAESVVDAAWILAQLRPLCAGEYPEIELWRGGDCLLGNDTMPQWALDLPARVSAATQRRLLETEEALLNSRQAVARSRKLLESTAQLRKGLARQGVGRH
ncbi:MAG TPA: hypothetical protein VFA23_01185 [Dongiaceae bacterium]|nr:hypothetical protein [Dongiaceae bacterium]